MWFPSTDVPEAPTDIPSTGILILRSPSPMEISQSPGSPGFPGLPKAPMELLPKDMKAFFIFHWRFRILLISSTAKAYIKSIKVNFSHEGGKIDAKSEAEAVSAVSYGSGISLKAVGRCADVAIFDASGSEMYRLTLDDDTKYIELPAGFYVVSSGGYRQKIIVR